MRYIDDIPGASKLSYEEQNALEKFLHNYKNAMYPSGPSDSSSEVVEQNDVPHKKWVSMFGDTEEKKSPLDNRGSKKLRELMDSAIDDYKRWESERGKAVSRGISSDQNGSSDSSNSGNSGSNSNSNSPDYDIDEMAGEFILGAWGNGQDRIDNMLNAGYTIDDYNAIQQRVNEAYESGRDLHEWANKANEKLKYW